MVSSQAFRVCFSDGHEKAYPASVTYEIGPGGTLEITDGDDIRIYSPTAWHVIKLGAPQAESGP